MSQLEAAFALGGCASERAFLVTEKFALDEILRDSSAIDADARCVVAWAFPIDSASHELFPGTALAVDQNGGLRAGDFPALGDKDASTLPPVDTDPDKIVYLAFTSATTGMPKGVLHSDRPHLANGRAVVHDWHHD